MKRRVEKFICKKKKKSENQLKCREKLRKSTSSSSIPVMTRLQSTSGLNGKNASKMAAKRARFVHDRFQSLSYLHVHQNFCDVGFSL